MNGHAAPAQGHVETPGQLALFGSTSVCDDCGCAFGPDSSPNAFLCWQCDEARAEAAGSGWFG